MSAKSRLHIPQAHARPGEQPDFSYLALSDAGVVDRPAVDSRVADIEFLTSELVRVLDDEHIAQGPWNPRLDQSSLLQAMRQDPRLTGTRVIIVTGTSYAEEPLRHLGTTFSIDQPKGLRTSVLIELLEAVLPILKPSYEPLPATEAIV